MPATSEKQRRFMGAELARIRAGKKTRTDMSEDQLAEFATKPKGGGLEERKRNLLGKIASVVRKKY